MKIKIKIKRIAVALIMLLNMFALPMSASAYPATESWSEFLDTDFVIDVDTEDIFRFRIEVDGMNFGTIVVEAGEEFGLKAFFNGVDITEDVEFFYIDNAGFEVPLPEGSLNFEHEDGVDIVARYEDEYFSSVGIFGLDSEYMEDFTREMGFIFVGDLDNFINSEPLSPDDEGVFIIEDIGKKYKLAPFPAPLGFEIFGSSGIIYEVIDGDDIMEVDENGLLDPQNPGESQIRWTMGSLTGVYKINYVFNGTGNVLSIEVSGGMPLVDYFSGFLGLGDAIKVFPINKPMTIKVDYIDSEGNRQDVTSEINTHISILGITNLNNLDNNEEVDELLELLDIYFTQEVNTPENHFIADYSEAYGGELQSLLASDEITPEERELYEKILNLNKPEGLFNITDLEDDTENFLNSFMGSIEGGGLLPVFFENLSTQMVSATYETEYGEIISTIYPMPLIVTTNPHILASCSLFPSDFESFGTEELMIYSVYANMLKQFSHTDQEVAIPVVKSESFGKIFDVLGVEVDGSGIPNPYASLLSMIGSVQPRVEIGLGIQQALGGPPLEDITFDIEGDSVEIDENGRVTPVKSGVSKIAWEWQGQSGYFNVNACGYEPPERTVFVNEDFPVYGIEPPKIDQDSLESIRNLSSKTFETFKLLLLDADWVPGGHEPSGK